MARDERRRQKKLAKKYSKQKAAKKELARRRAGGLAIRLADIARAPVHHCLLFGDLVHGGMARLLFSRRLNDGQIAFTLFLLDGYCLGVKDAVGGFAIASQYDERFGPQSAHWHSPQKVSPEYAKKLLEELVEYARKLGFAPPVSFKSLMPIFGDVDAALCTDQFTFGDMGKPHFISGPNDSLERCLQIRDRLRESVGEGNFGFTIFSGGDSLAEVLGPSYSLGDDDLETLEDDDEGDDDIDNDDESSPA